MLSRPMEYLQSLVNELRKLPHEIEWVEFKCNNKDPERMAKYISAISNAATLNDKPYGYIAWGIDDETHDVVGIDFSYRAQRKGGEELEAWLSRMLNPRINFRFYEVPIADDKTVLLLEIPCAEREPTKFESVAYIRVGSNLKPLMEYKGKEAELWRKFDTTPHELRTAAFNVPGEELISRLDVPGYYDKMEQPLPRTSEKMLEDLSNEKFIRKNDAGNWDITVMGALLAAKDMNQFDALAHRTVRVIRYKGSDRLQGVQEREFVRGYAVDFEEVIQYIMSVIPREEVLVGGIRKQQDAFPEIAVRELLANAIIHQALDQQGTNPMVEIFNDRMEFSNAGAPLIEIRRIVDTVPVSRNEHIAKFMHKCGICEERGSGYDKIVTATSSNAMLAPKVESQNGKFTKAVIFARVPFDITTMEERVWTCYMQACLAYVQFKSIANADIRNLFGLTEKEKAKVSRIIKETISAGLIRPVDPETAPRYMRYVPFWS